MEMILSSNVSQQSIKKASGLIIGGSFSFLFYYLAFTDSSIRTILGVIATIMLIIMFAGIYQILIFRKRPDFEIWLDKIIFSEDTKPSMKAKSYNISIKNIDYIEQDVDVFIIITKDGKRLDIPHWDLFQMNADKVADAFKKTGLKVNYIES